MKKIFLKFNLIFLLSLTVVFLIVIFSFSHLINKKKSTIADNLGNIIHAEKQQSIIVDLKKTINQAKLSQAEIASYFLSKDGTVVFLNNLESLGEKVGVSVSINGLNLNKATGGFEVMLQTKGNFSDSYRFLLLIENLPYFSTFNSFDMNVIPEDKNTKITVNGKEVLKPVGPTQWDTKLRFTINSYIAK